MEIDADAGLGGINYCYFVLETYRVIIQSSLFFSNNIGGLPEQRHDAGYKKSKCYTLQLSHNQFWQICLNSTYFTSYFTFYLGCFTPLVLVKTNELIYPALISLFQLALYSSLPAFIFHPARGVFTDTSISSLCQRFTYSFGSLHLRCQYHVFNCCACNYQTVTP